MPPTRQDLKQGLCNRFLRRIDHSSRFQSRRRRIHSANGRLCERASGGWLDRPGSARQRRSEGACSQGTRPRKQGLLGELPASLPLYHLRYDLPRPDLRQTGTAVPDFSGHMTQVRFDLLGRIGRDVRNSGQSGGRGNSQEDTPMVKKLVRPAAAPPQLDVHVGAP
jgi:hypothetical protein